MLTRNKVVYVITALALVVILVGVAVMSPSSDSRIPLFDSQAGYRLVPEKISRSAIIVLAVPQGTLSSAPLAEQITFDPDIDGTWISDQELGSLGVSVARAADRVEYLYFRPDRSLQEDRHYAVQVAGVGATVLRSDFLAVADPEIISILPVDDEVLPDSKISIVFNRPMVPLTTLDVQPTRDLPVSITPATPGKFRWIGTHTLQFIPTTELISSAAYTVSVEAGLTSLDGLPIKPKKVSFTTRHLRYLGEPKDQTKTEDVVRGYNQPFLVRFNQPVDLDASVRELVVRDDTGNVPIRVSYHTHEKGDDLSTLAIYPTTNEGRWWPGRSYTVTFNKVYPKSGGSIFLETPRTFSFVVDDIISNIRVTSPRTNQPLVDRFDPSGELILTFYEPIDLTKSRIVAPHIEAITYGEICKAQKSSACVKEPDRTQVKITFESSAFKPGDAIPVQLEKIISDANGSLIGARAMTVDLRVYQPLIVYSVTSADSLGTITLCTNNPLYAKGAPGMSSDTGIILNPQTEVMAGTYSSFLTTESAYGPRVCEPGQFTNTKIAYLSAATKYTGTATVGDVFGQKATVPISFQSRSVRADDYELRSFQGRETVTVPGRTKLTFAARFVPEVTVTVCRLRAYDYHRVRVSDMDPSTLCQTSVDKKILLPAQQPNQSIFSVDLGEYVSDPVGTFAVMLSSPYINSREQSWRYDTQVLVTVTRLIVTEKQIKPLAEQEGQKALTETQLDTLRNLYWVIDATTRMPVPGVTVSIYRHGNVAATTVTNNEGLAFARPVVESEVTTATLGTDTVVVSDSSSVLRYAFEASNRQQVYIYTDKPIYRPGQEINIKGIYREGYDGYYTIPERQAVDLKIYDSANKIVAERQLETNVYGSVATTYALPTEAALGSYRACVKTSCGYFEVLNYVPAAFQITFEDAKDEVVLNQDLEVRLKAAYYFGVPLADAAVTYRTTSQYYYFDKYTKEYFAFNNLTDDPTEGRYYYGDKYIGGGEAILDSRGEALLEPKMTADTAKPTTSRIIILDTTVKNQQGRSVSGQKSFVLHAAPAYIGSKLEQSFAAAGQSVDLKIQTVDTAGVPIDLGQVTAEMYRVKWVPVDRDAGNGRTHITWTRQRELVKTERARTDSMGAATIKLVASSEGSYEIDITSGRSGAAVGSRSYFYSYGSAVVPVQSADDTYLNIISDTNTLRAGDTADIVFEVPEGSAKALVTLERGTIFSYEVIDVKGSMAHYRFPVKAAYYPNVYVSVVAYPPEHAVRSGSKRFVVDSDQKKLTISITPDRAAYRPGDQVKLDLRATDTTGRPVSSELSLAVVDMSVLALRGNPKKNMADVFYGNVPLTVWTHSNFRNLLKQFDRSAALNQDEGGKGGSGGDRDDKRRGVFKEVAYWNPRIMTDQEGRATVSFTLPDNLTTWQVEVVGVTDDTKVGAAYREFTTNKSLMINPLKPRFALPGDTFMLGATIFNRSADTFDGVASMKAPVLTSLSRQADQRLSIKPGESKNIYWDVEVPLATKPGEVTFSIDVAGSGLSDAVDASLAIHTHMMYEVTATAGQTETSTTEFIYLPPDIQTDRGQLTLHTSATLAGFLTKPLEYLLAYPYGCTEQVASQIRGVALIKRGQAIPNNNTASLPTSVTYKGKEYTHDQIIREGLQMIYARQNPDGGFKYWSADIGSSYFATREALDTFRVLDDIGVEIDQSRWKRAADYLYGTYTNPQNTLDHEQVLDIASVLFARDEYRFNASLRQSVERAGEAFVKANETSNGILIKTSELLHRYDMLPAIADKIDHRLRNRVVVDSRGSFLDAGEAYHFLENSISNTANYVNLLVIRKQADPMLPDMLRWLMSSRDREGAWGTTHATLSVISAFSDYLEWRPETSAQFVMENTLNGSSVQTFAFTPQTILARLTKDVPLSDLHVGKMNALQIGKKTDGPGKVYYDMSLTYYLSPEKLPVRDEGFAISRGLYALTGDSLDTPLVKAKVGDVVRQHIEITVPVTRRNVIIEDFIPAGMEIVDTSLATEDQTLDAGEKSVKDKRLYPTHKEMRDDRQVLVVDTLPPGQYEFDYFLRALVPGTYTYLPARVSEMYNPENFGRTSAGRFVVEK